MKAAHANMFHHWWKRSGKATVKCMYFHYPKDIECPSSVGKWRVDMLKSCWCKLLAGIARTSANRIMEWKISFFLVSANTQPTPPATCALKSKNIRCLTWNKLLTNWLTYNIACLMIVGIKIALKSIGIVKKQDG